MRFEHKSKTYTLRFSRITHNERPRWSEFFYQWTELTKEQCEEAAIALGAAGIKPPMHAVTYTTASLWELPSKTGIGAGTARCSHLDTHVREDGRVAALNKLVDPTIKHPLDRELAGAVLAAYYGRRRKGAPVPTPAPV
jgi:hypothetical protein